ncbi:MAG TPA: hypothetical protein VGO67_19305 [Verrucomicrobiae bacterium]
MASSADGSRQAALGYPDGIYTWQSVPVLNISQVSDKVALSWQASSSAEGFVLQAGSDLMASNWALMTNIITQTNGMNGLLVPISPSGNEYFRLLNFQ